MVHCLFFPPPAEGGKMFFICGRFSGESLRAKGDLKKTLESDLRQMNVFVIFHFSISTKKFERHNLPFIANRMLLPLISKSHPLFLHNFVFYRLKFPFPQIKVFQRHNLTFVVIPMLLPLTFVSHKLTVIPQIKLFAHHNHPFVAHQMLFPLISESNPQQLSILIFTQPDFRKNQSLYMQNVFRGLRAYIFFTTFLSIWKLFCKKFGRKYLQ